MTTTADDQLERLVADMRHLANAFRKRRPPNWEEHAQSMEWCAQQLAAVKEARR